MTGLPIAAEESVRLTKKPVKIVIPPYGISIAESHHERGFVMAPMRNSYTKIYYILDGIADCYVERNVAHLERENVLVVPRGATHYLRDKESSPLWLYIVAVRNNSLEHLATFNEQIEQLNALSARHLKPLTTHDYAAYDLPRMLRKILYEQRMRASGFVPAIQATLLNLVVALNRIYLNIPVEQQFAGDKPTVNRIQHVAHYIEKNFFEPVSVENMARMACLSVRQFTNQFKAVYGVTFMQYLHYHRTRYAQRLLAETDQEIISICFASGFNDLAHFYRIFKRYTTLSPRQYRLNSGYFSSKAARSRN